MTKKLTVGILFGGKSVEHEISIRSAINVVQNMDKDRFEPVLIGIDKKGGWFQNTEVSEHIDTGDALVWYPTSEGHYLKNIETDKELKPDVVFPVLHGTDGEDGSIQGLFQVANLPVVGSGVLGSSVSMDKLFSKRLLKEAGVPTGNFIAFHRYQKDQVNFDDIETQLGLPFIIKPARLGSSVGVSKVNNETEFLSALDETFQYDQVILIEEFIEGRELECAVIGNEEPIASRPGEIVLQKDYDFYTYEAKYLDKDAVSIIVPAEVEDRIVRKIQEFSINAYQSLGCEDFARVDLFLKEDGTVLINEVNTIPGFTNASMFPMLWQDAGITYKDLISRLIDMALLRFNHYSQLKTDFQVGASE
ncbi:D-alanine--D-alanine ligase family protein [Fulvivirgaceae bacterium BMA10]|uniref:D-alanine--D-alanine ligase n=1 Tax=Splendidivirga corallicola TaxID=3051826 RepID=A0ABT8KSR2_9BACT|nr:D-alanine--D-alanine ligase family protein [Fulvivirgaceae bacterium BMA10]